MLLAASAAGLSFMKSTLALEPKWLWRKEEEEGEGNEKWGNGQVPIPQPPGRILGCVLARISRRIQPSQRDTPRTSI